MSVDENSLLEGFILLCASGSSSGNLPGPSGTAAVYASGRNDATDNDPKSDQKRPTGAEMKCYLPGCFRYPSGINGKMVPDHFPKLGFPVFPLFSYVSHLFSFLFIGFLWFSYGFPLFSFVFLLFFVFRCFP